MEKALTQYLHEQTQMTVAKDPNVALQDAFLRRCMRLCNEKVDLVSTIFSGLPLQAGKWYETYRKHDGAKVFSSTLEEAKKAHSQLMME